MLYIVVTLKNTKSIREDINNSISLEKIIFFWEINIDEYPFFDSCLAELRYRVRTLEFELMNTAYENGYKPIPKVQSIEETLDDLVNNRKSICRFGDGEMRWIVDSDEVNSKLPIWFQEQDANLKQRLREVIHSTDENIIIAITDIFGGLDSFVQSDKEFYREFLNTDGFR